MALIFISYRSSDGKDKATALARDLGAVFGDEEVFLDKDDLRAGVRWRDEIAQTLQARPVLLLLLTPQLLAATDAQGGLRIEDPADPVRREVAAALAGGAHFVPILCDGLAEPPPAADLPEPFNRIGEFTWRQLRAYDWQQDVRRLVDDLHALGIAAAPSVATVPQPTAPPSVRTTRRWLSPALAAAAALTLGVGWYAWRASPPAAQQAPAPTTVAKESTTDVSGSWLATVAADEKLSLWLRQTGALVELNSRPVVISARADWTAYRSFWRERFGSELDTVSYRGQGSASALPGAELVVDIALQVVSIPGEVPIDTGNLHATISADGETLVGTMWSNGAQKERPVSLVRTPPTK